jgi:hypothetical protein
MSPTPRELDARAVGLILLLSALWGGNNVAIKIGLADAPPIALGFLRFLLGGAWVLAWGWWTRAPFAPRAGELGPLAAVGVLFTVATARDRGPEARVTRSRSRPATGRLGLRLLTLATAVQLLGPAPGSAHASRPPSSPPRPPGPCRSWRGSASSRSPP